MGLLEAFQDCGGPYPLEAEHTKTNYENFPTTPDELAVIRYLASVLPPDSGLRLLHIGLGNGEFFETLGKKLSSYTTVTISQPEIDRFCERHPDAANTRVLGVEGLKTLASKYQLACESITVQTLTQGAETDETVWLLTKMN